MKITKIKEGMSTYGPYYLVLADGRSTGLFVHKSVPPKYMHPQTWDVTEGDDPQNILFETTSLMGALLTIGAIYDAIVSSVENPL